MTIWLHLLQISTSEHLDGWIYVKFGKILLKQMKEIFRQLTCYYYGNKKKNLLSTHPIKEYSLQQQYGMRYKVYFNSLSHLKKNMSQPKSNLQTSKNSLKNKTAANQHKLFKMLTMKYKLPLPKDLAFLKNAFGSSVYSSVKHTFSSCLQFSVLFCSCECCG